jgi:Transglutaminase-like superfamily
MQAYWASQSPVTDPGPCAAAAIDALPGDLAALREASSQLMFHFQTGGGFADNGVPAGRMSEINTRYADAMLCLVLQRGDPVLDRGRPPSERVVGCCRDATVLFLALARAKGIPARARVGAAAYFEPGWLCEHEVAEVWDEAEGRWRLVDPQMDAAGAPEVNGVTVDWLDLAPDQFVTGPRAWQATRGGTCDPERHVVFPGLDVPGTRGWPEIAHNVIHDLAALNKTEMLLWDGWGMLVTPGFMTPGPVPEPDAAVLDEVCAATADPAVPADAVAALAARDGLRVPQAVTRFDPNGAPTFSLEDVTRVLAARGRAL